MAASILHLYPAPLFRLTTGTDGNDRDLTNIQSAAHQTSACQQWSQQGWEVTSEDEETTRGKGRRTQERSMQSGYVVAGKTVWEKSRDEIFK